MNSSDIFNNINGNLCGWPVSQPFQVQYDMIFHTGYRYCSKIAKMCPKAAATMLNIIIMCSQIVWGVLISSHFPFYPTEAENKGAKAYQVQHAFKLFWGTYPKNAIHFYIERKILKSFLCL